MTETTGAGAIALPFSLALAAASFGAPLFAQDAQSRLWDATIAGDTLGIRQALADGARIDSLDTRRNRSISQRGGG